MTAKQVMTSLRLISITAFCTSLFWLLIGALYWPYASGAPESGVSSPTPASAPLPATDQQAPGLRRMVIPVLGVPKQSLIDTYEDARADGQRQHDAIDIPAPEGTAVVAAAAGTVEKLYTSQDGGNSLYVRSPDRTVLFYYAHLRNYAPGLAEGDVVQPGDPLGAVGWTGNASRDAPHLHFAVSMILPTARWWEASTPLNPYGLLQSGSY
ncbi:MAG: M23 family metallopeptidase [Alteraurantiacibacter sp.]